VTRLFISEYLCSGAWPEAELDASLAREGRAMLLALLEDAASVPGWNVCTTWDQRLGEFPLRDVDARIVCSPQEEARSFVELAAAAEGVYVIAPELDDQLTVRCRTVPDSRGRLFNSSLCAMESCSDKLATCERLQSAGVPTIPTCLLTPEVGFTDELPVVVKPRFGAGSHETYLVRGSLKASRQPDAQARETLVFDNSNPSLALWATVETASRNSNMLRQFAAVSHAVPILRPMICQPHIAGRALSVAVIVRDGEQPVEVWPVAEQHLSSDGRFRYLGGRIPARSAPIPQIAALAEQTIRVLPGLRGYVGLDIILPDGSPEHPLVVEVNPRMTTSYLGYRALAVRNLAPLVLLVDDDVERSEWRDGCVTFDAAGRII
jgi:predicted ATP-grasp superfamily ATP-dependent carboligase